MEHENTQVVQTCWAVMSLMYAKYPHPEPIEKGVRLVMSRQQPVSILLALPNTILMVNAIFLPHRTVHGLKKLSRVYLTKTAPSRTQCSNFHSQFGCWARRIDIWQNSNPIRLEVGMGRPSTQVVWKRN